MQHKPVTQNSVSTDDQDIINLTRHWLEKAVIGLNLCPFAKQVYVKNQLKIVVSHEVEPEKLAALLQQELTYLQSTPADVTDTTLIVHPQALLDFYDYNDFLGVADDLIVNLGLEGSLQIASFHPDYQFAGTPKDSIDNYTNRSPYPMLHLLRESSIDRAVKAFPEPEAIYETNMETLRQLGKKGWDRLMSEQGCQTKL